MLEDESCTLVRVGEGKKAMTMKVDEKKSGPGPDKKPGFFRRLFASLDKKLEQKAKEAPCCSGAKKGKGSCS